MRATIERDGIQGKAAAALCGCVLAVAVFGCDVAFSYLGESRRVSIGQRLRSLHRPMEQERRCQGRQELHHHFVQQASSYYSPSVVILLSHLPLVIGTSLPATTEMCTAFVDYSLPNLRLIGSLQDATHSFVASPEIVTVQQRHSA